MAEECIIRRAEEFVMNRQAWMPFLAAIVLATAASAQTVNVRVDGSAIHHSVTTLASPDWQGRRTLTPGFDRAADWAAARLREWGLKPAGDSGTFFQAVPIVGPRSDFAWTTGMPGLVVNGRAFSFKEGEFVVDPSSTAATDVTAEGVFVGYGISAPAKGLDEYASTGVSGKIVFALRGSPRDAPPDLTDFPPDLPTSSAPPEPWTEESADRAKVMTAYRKGAAAIVLCDANPEARRAQPWPRAKVQASPFTRPFLVIAANDPRILRALMLRDENESLVGFVDRMNRLRRAVQQNKVRSETTGVPVRIKGFDVVTLYGESFGNNQSRNVLAKVGGTDPALAGQAVVIGAHLDHLGFRSGLVHPGADDNASGSAVVLETARIFAAAGIRPRRTVIFALWCGEENGHHGSRRFTSAPPDGLTMDRVIAYINMDMVGLGTMVDVNGARDFPIVFKVMMRDQLPEVTRAVRPEVSGPGGSDYASFLAHGIDSVSLNTSGGNGHPDYHDSTDVPQKLQPELLGTVGQFVLQAAFNLANETGTRLPVPGRREACDALRFVVPDIAGQSPERWRTLTARTPGELQAVVVNAIREFRKGRDVEPAGRSSESPARVFVGVKATAVAGHLALLDAANAALDVARLDLEGDDGIWVQGGLTGAGKVAMKAVEQMGITPNLVRPTAALLADVLESTSRPVLVSGMTAANEAMARQVMAKAGAFALECAADHVSSCAERLQGLHSALGGGANLLVSMHVDPAAAVQAHRALYLELARKGWSKDDIFAIAGLTPDGTAGGNLARFTTK
jgi:hypothetical protein